MIDGLISGLIVAWVMFVIYMVGSQRDVRKATANRPKDMTTFHVQIPKDEAIRAIIEFAQRSKLKVESVEEVQGKIVLGQNMGLWTKHFGYWLQIYVSEDAQRMSTIEIGIRPKTFQVGSRLQAICATAVDNIEAALNASRM